MKKKTAIIVLIYNRPEHTKKLLESIEVSKSAGDFVYFFFCDGAKNSLDIEKISKIRKLLVTFKKNFKTKIFFRKKILDYLIM